VYINNPHTKGEGKKKPFTMYSLQVQQ